jgi:hypothetical protein
VWQRDRIDSDEYIRTIHKLLATRRDAERASESKFPDESAELRSLKEKACFLEAQLESQRPFLQLYRLGAGCLFVAIISIVIWLITGTGIPFHPIFAAGVIPAALGVIVMAFLIRPKPPVDKQ